MREETSVSWKVVQVISIFITTAIVLYYLPYHSMQTMEKAIVLGVISVMVILIALATAITVLVELNEHRVDENKVN